MIWMWLIFSCATLSMYEARKATVSPSVPAIDEQASAVHIRSRCKLAAQTGVEMEALMAVSVAALTIYDMCKAVDKGMRIDNIRLLSKSGGRSGDWQAQEKNQEQGGS